MSAAPMAAVADNALAQLREIPLPAPVPYTPQTWGWAVLGVLLVVALAAVLRHVWQRHRANRYRRAALREWAILHAHAQDNRLRAQALRALPALVKRTALAAEPRARVAALSAQAWLDYLDRSLPGAGFARGPGRALMTMAYARELPDAEQSEALFALTRRWIGHHRAGL
jgi:hypothetical protein